MCHVNIYTGAIMAVAAMLLSAVAGLAGSFAQASALNAQAKAQEQIAEFNARQKEIEANRRQAQGAAQADQEEKQSQSLAGKARAAFAQIGVDTSQGSPLLLESDILTTGQYKSNIAVSDAANEQRNLQEAAKADRFEGQIRAMASRSQAQASILGGIGSAFSSLSKISFG